MKPTIFSRLRKTFRKHKHTIATLERTIAYLERRVSEGQMQVRDLNFRLNSLVSCKTWVDHESDQIRMQVAVNKKTLALARDPDAYFHEVMRQLVASFKRDLMK